MNSFVLSGGNIFSDCEIKTGTPISASLGVGVFILEIPITFTVRPFSCVKVLNSVSGYLSVNSKFLTQLTSSHEIVNIRTSVDHTLTHQRRFVALLTKANLDQLELNRSASDLNLEIKLTGSIFSLDKTSTQNITAETVSTEMTYQVPQSRWIEFLKVWKYAPTLNLEFILNFESPLLLKAGGFLLEAQNFYLTRHSQQAIAECRKALDCVVESLGAGRESLSKLLENKHNNGLRERILVSILAAKHICDPATHGGENASEHNWSQDDALYIIRMTAAVLLRASKG